MAESPGPYHRISTESEDDPQVFEQQPRHKYKGTLYKFGITEVVFGSISILLAIVMLIIAANYKTYTYVIHYNNQTEYDTDTYFHLSTHLSQGIWCGALLIVTGILGIKAKTTPSLRMFIGNMTLAIITACFMALLISFSVLAAGSYAVGQLKSLLVLHSILAILGFPAAIICIIHSAYCCAGMCCQRKEYQSPATYAAHSYGTHHPQQMVRLANGQYMLVPFQPMASYGYHQSSAGPALYLSTKAGVVRPQLTMQPQAAAEQPTIVYPAGAQQPPSPEVP